MRRLLLVPLLMLSAIAGAIPRPALSQANVLSVPIRWCVIGEQLPDGTKRGAPAYTNPANVGEPDTDGVLWRRHERISDAIFIPEANVTLRSAFLAPIVANPNLDFPIIPDQDLSDPDHAYGDVLSQEFGGTELVATYNACVAAWKERGVGNIGIVAINARQIVDPNGERVAGGWGWPGDLIVEDNAWKLPGSRLMLGRLLDGVDKTLGHEVGHALGLLGHTCDNTNLMHSGGVDLNGDLLVDDIHLSTSIVECTGPPVNQVTQLYERTKATPGCKVDGTDTPCSSVSDVQADSVTEIVSGERALDLSLVFVTEPEPGTTTEFAHELLGPFTEATFAQFTRVEYFFLADLDGDPTTGGAPATLGIPTAFQGAELVTRVQVSRRIIESQAPMELVAVPTLWKFTDGAFRQMTDPSIQARVDPQIGIGDPPIDDGDQNGRAVEAHITDLVVIAFPSAIQGPRAVPFRAQALNRGVRLEGPAVVDLLDERPGEPGVEFRLQHPIFPVCSVSPNPAQPGSRVTVEVSRLLPNRGAHVVFGADLVAQGATDSSGGARISFNVPADTPARNHLVTVGTDDTALTADCFLEVAGPPFEPTDLALTKSATPNPAIAGRSLVYTLSVTNHGPTSASQVRVVDTLPTGIVHQSNTAGCVETPPGVLTCELGQLLAGETRQIQITVLVEPDVVQNVCRPTVLTNIATVENLGGPDADPSNNSVSVDTPVVPDRATFAFPSTGIRDSFNRQNGALKNNWYGDARLTGYQIVNRQLDIGSGGPIYWKAGAFGPTLEAYTTFVRVDPDGGEQALLLKVQGEDNNPDYRKGAVKVVYDAKARAIRVETIEPGQPNWRICGSFATTLHDGDQLGARALADGWVELFHNGQRIGVAHAGSFFVNKRGRIGLWFRDAGDAVIDDFGGGTPSH